MSALYRRVLLPPVALATRRDAEVAMDAHLRAMRAMQARPALLRLAARRHGTPPDPLLVQDLLDGLHFPHPFGVAAGYDKNAAVYPAFEAHFTPGFVEVGTVTLRPQEGNPRPRVQRLPGGHLVNCDGLPQQRDGGGGREPARTPGADRAAGGERRQAEGHPRRGGRSRVRRGGPAVRDPGERTPGYYVVNVSSPNTPGLRALQEGGRLSAVLAAVAAALDEQVHLAARPRRRLLVKLAPELGPPASRLSPSSCCTTTPGGWC